MPDQPSQQEMSWPDLARALIWLATADGVPAMQQIEAARLVFDAWTIRVNTNVGGMPECPLLAISRHRAPTSGTSALPPKAAIGRWPQRRPESRRRAADHPRSRRGRPRRAGGGRNAAPIAVRMSAYGGKADSLAHLSACPLLAEAVEKVVAQADF